MSVWIIYDKTGLAKCGARKLEYSGEFLGACSVSVSISSPSPIGFEVGDWLEYRGERFELNYDPSVVKEASIGAYGEGFVYENVVFNSLSDELTRCDFLDVVPADNHIHYTSLPNFSFFAENVEALAERLQANLNRVYKGDKSWTVSVHPEFTGKTDVNVVISNQTCWDALTLAKSEFEANFIIKGRHITIGTSGIAVGRLFSYGKGNGLFKIEKNAESNQKIVTRLRAYGSTRNLPTHYYQNLEDGNVPNNMAVKHLMLPSFPTETLDPYIDSKNIDALGVRESTVFFDGTNGLEEIYPTMDGMTAEDLKKAGVYVNATGALDVIVSAEQMTDNGIIPEGGELKGNFKVTLKDIGFDINEHLSASGSATLAMKSGMCSGREFEIEACVKTSNGYELTCKRTEDSGLGLVFPYKDYQIKPDDKFVLLNIEMPDVYIKAASQRLLSVAKDYLAKNDYVRYSYTPTLDHIFLARQHDEAISNGEVSIHDAIKEGDFILFEDEDLGVSGSITIDSLTIKEDASESIIPEYTLTLRNEKSVGTIEKIQNQVASILNGVSGGSVNTEQVKSIVEAVGSVRFLSKTKDDRSKGIVASDKGFEAGQFMSGATGVGVYQNADGQWMIETDNISVRRKASFNEVEIQTTNHIGGQTLLSPASMKVERVEVMSDRYRCFFRKKDSDGNVVHNQWKDGDLAYCNTFNLEKQGDGTIGNHYYWREVVDVSEDDYSEDWHYVDLSVSKCSSGSSEPKSGDKVVQLGYSKNDDANRQNAIIIAGAGVGSPYIQLFVGINSFVLPEPDQLKPGDNRLSGRLTIEAGSTGWENLEGLPDSIQDAVDLANKAQETIDKTSVGAVNLLRNSGFTGDYHTEDMITSEHLDSNTELFSKKLDKWMGDAVVYADTNAVSGYSVQLGALSQSVKELIANENYVVSFKAQGSSVVVTCGDFKQNVAITSAYKTYSIKFAFSGSKTFEIEGNARICDLQLERGTIATDWNPSPYDNDKAYAEFQSLQYLQDAIVNGSTNVIGGLILSSIMKLGNFKDGVMNKVNAGVSGIYNDDDDVAFWGGGTFEQAIKTIIKFKENPQYNPTEEEWRGLANFVVSHGGDAIFKGSVFADNGYFRGIVYALGGKFKGEIEATSGVFKNVTSPNGAFLIDDEGKVRIVGTIETSLNGKRIVLDAETQSITLFDEYEREAIKMDFLQDVGESWTYGRILMSRYAGTSSNTVQFRTEMIPNYISMENLATGIHSVYEPEGVMVTNSDGSKDCAMYLNNINNTPTMKADKFWSGDKQGLDNTVSFTTNNRRYSLVFKGGLLVGYTSESINNGN